jgi:hypothetical protein
MFAWRDFLCKRGFTARECRLEPIADDRTSSVPILDITQALIILFLAGRTVIRSGALSGIEEKSGGRKHDRFDHAVFGNNVCDDGPDADCRDGDAVYRTLRHLQHRQRRIH